MRKFKKIILFTFLAVVAINCTNDETFTNEINQKTVIDLSNDYLQLKYTSSLSEDGILNISLEDLDKASKYKMALDVSSKGYRLDISKVLESYSKDWLKDIEPMQSKLLAQSILDYVNNDTNPLDFKKEEMQGLFYVMSVFNAINRYQEISMFKSTQTTPILQNTPYDGYITGLTPFRAKEDIILNISDFENWLDNYTGSKLLDRDIVYIKTKINGLQNLSLKEYQNLVHEPLNTQNQSNVSTEDDDEDDCWFLCGGDCGCCGNYEGQCYYANVLCYAHDYLCESCDPGWFCFSGCQPTPC